MTVSRRDYIFLCRELSRDIHIVEEDLICDELVFDSSEEFLLSNCTNLEPITSDKCMCDMCGQIFLDENALAEHKTTHHHDEEPSGVETDEEYFLNEDDLVHFTPNDTSGSTNNPIKKKPAPFMSKNSNGKFECTICHKMFQLKSEVREHYFRLHCGCELLQCPQCKFTCYSKSSLDVHLIKCHTKRYTCEKCGKMFPYKYQLMTHINAVHLNIRNHTCDLCGKSFKTRANFDTHMARHRDVRNFPCPHCDHRSRTGHDLAVHVRKHTGEKPYVCDVCGKAFAHSINRIKHQRNVHDPSRIEDLTELPAQQSFTRDVVRIKYQRNVHSKSQTGELDRLQFPDNELVGD